MARDWALSIRRGARVGESRLAWGLVVGTIPVGIAGLLFGGLVEAHLRSPLVIAAATIVFGLLLWWADRHGSQARQESHLRWLDFIYIGGAQALALVPGTSRSGVTMTAALALGLDRASAARFSFLLAIPVIFLAGGSKAFTLSRSGENIDWGILVLGGSVAAACAFASIHLFLKLLDRIGLLPFVLYRLALGAVLLALFT